ncbi:MAG: crosslink repair DNA glycosylase YcaQ family protein [Terriglobia bacterium]
MKDAPAWRWHRQGLDGSLAGRSAAEVLKMTGWSRSVGSANPYLALFARAGLRREKVDAALAACEIHELPSARGCTYVLPAEDFALGLAVGRSFRGNEMKVAAKLGVTDDEMENLRGAIAKALAKGPLDPDAIRSAVGDTVRSLGPEGKKKGITTTLPVALGLLQSAGEIRRVPVNGRLDQQRYRYAGWNIKPSGDYSDLARKFFAWTGGAPAAEFQAFAGLGVKAAKDAMEPLKLVGVEGDILMLPADCDAYENFQPPKQPQYSLVGSLDNILPPPGVQEVGLHRIIDRGRLAGTWDFDSATESIVWKALGKADNALKEAVRRTEAFIREDIAQEQNVKMKGSLGA